MAPPVYGLVAYNSVCNRSGYQKYGSTFLYHLDTDPSMKWTSWYVISNFFSWFCFFHWFMVYLHPTYIWINICTLQIVLNISLLFVDSTVVRCKGKYIFRQLSLKRFGFVQVNFNWFINFFVTIFEFFWVEKYCWK